MNFIQVIAKYHSRILILDFGSQYSQLIARRIRDLGVYSEIYSWDANPELFLEFKPSGVILSGGHESVIQTDTGRIPDEIFQLQCPILGICYGMQALATQLGGKVIVGTHREFGEARMCIQQNNPLFAGIVKSDIKTAYQQDIAKPKHQNFAKDEVRENISLSLNEKQRGGTKMGERSVLNVHEHSHQITSKAEETEEARSLRGEQRGGMKMGERSVLNVHEHSHQIANKAELPSMTELLVWMSHGDAVSHLPPGFITIGTTDHTPIAAMADLQRHYYGVQFHPEVTHTLQGENIFAQFIFDICGCEANWQPTQIIEQSIEWIRQQIGKEEVLLALSGGVDSAVAAALLHQAIGNQLHCVFVDNGLLRLNEAAEVMDIFARGQGIRVKCVDASARFLAALEGVEDPEKKRRIIGHEFIAVFDEYAAQLPAIQWLAQGTIYPDVIESAKTLTGKGQVIKSHHNVGGLPETMKLKLIEPLRELFKDEVRKIGIELNLPYERVYRHPFPGPGLAVRILGEVKLEYIHILQKVDAIFLDELRAHQLYDEISQAFAVFLPVKAVAVKGDARHYEYVVALRAVKTTDFMTAQWAALPTELLAWIATRIMNEVPGVARVTYDISNKPPATIEWE